MKIVLAIVGIAGRLVRKMKIAAIEARAGVSPKKHRVTRPVRCNRIAVSAEVGLVVEQHRIYGWNLTGGKIAIAGHAKSMSELVHNDAHKVAFVRRYRRAAQLWLRIEPIEVLKKTGIEAEQNIVPPDDARV